MTASLNTLHDPLTAAMAGIGMNFAVLPDPAADIEATFVAAAAIGMDDGDLRVLGILTLWFGVHGARLNAERLVPRIGARSPRVRAYGSALGRWQAQDPRWAPLILLHSGPPLELLPVGTQFQLQRRGVDPRFDGSALWVPAGSLRERASDILTPEALVRLHPGYRNRVLMGPSWRADVWTALERAPGMATADLARQIGCPLAAAGQVAEDFHLWRRATA